MSRIERLIDRAVKVAATSKHEKWKVGSILLRGSSVIAFSPNVVRNEPWITQGVGSSFHSEERCLRKVFYSADRAEGTTIVVARISKKGIQRLARPCHSCYKMLVLAGVRNIVYTLDDHGYGLEMVTK